MTCARPHLQLGGPTQRFRGFSTLSNQCEDRHTFGTLFSAFMVKQFNQQRVLRIDERSTRLIKASDWSERRVINRYSLRRITPLRDSMICLAWDISLLCSGNSVSSTALASAACTARSNSACSLLFSWRMAPPPHTL
jgi:hypothetical protein